MLVDATRTITLAGGTGRPARVLQALASHRPREEVARAHELIGADAFRKAISPLEPTVVVNRSTDDVIAMLGEGGRFSTAFHPRAGNHPPSWVDVIRQNQQRLGIYGEGAEAGRTTFGSVHRAADVGRPGFEGVTGYGPVVLELRPQVLPRATFSGDSLVARPEDVAPVEYLADSFAEFATSDKLSRLSDSAAATQVLDGVFELLGRARSSGNGLAYVEAHITGATVDDVARITLASRTFETAPGTFNELRELARSRGIPLRRAADSIVD